MLITSQIRDLEQILNTIRPKDIRQVALKKFEDIKVVLKEAQKEASYLKTLRSIINPNTDWAFSTQEGITGLFESPSDVSKTFENYKNPVKPDPARVKNWKKKVKNDGHRK
jgi:hypothetical protein